MTQRQVVVNLQAVIDRDIYLIKKDLKAVLRKHHNRIMRDDGVMWAQRTRSGQMRAYLDKLADAIEKIEVVKLGGEK